MIRLDSYWKEFAHTGKVEAYLSYREMEAIEAVARDEEIQDGKRAGVNIRESDDNLNRYSAKSDTDGRLR